MNFDLNDFRTRAGALADQMKWSHATLSKRLFSTARTLPSIMSRDVPDAEKTFPRLDTLLEAERRLSQLEVELPAGEAA